ncbi:unnamed protein product [Lymnaea stagnalis]|uniref:Uncharacterized protein n=1 Tax=Lymnaea stagnalis TaxID=6523 RepID=A0AAV2I1I5_LYMST
MKLDAADCAGKDTTRMRIQLLEAYVKDLNEQNEMLVQMVEEATQAKEDLCFRERQKIQQIQKLKDTLACAQEDLDNERENNATFNRELTALKNENNRLQRQCEEAQNEVQMLNDTVTEQQTIINKSHQKARALEEDIKACSGDVQQLEQMLDSTKEELDRSRANIQELEGTIEALKEDLSRLDEKQESLERTNQKMSRDIECLNEALDQKQNECMNLENQVGDLTQELKIIEKKLCNALEENEALRCKNCLYSEKISCAEENVGDTPKYSCCCVCSHIENLECEKRELETLLQRYQETHSWTNAEYNRLEDELACASSKLKDCMAAIDEKCQQVNDLNNELCCVREDLAEMEEKQRFTISENNSLKKKIADMEQDMCAMKEECDRLKDDLRKCSTELQNMDRTAASLENELKNRNSLLVNKENENAALKEELRDTKAECMQYKNLNQNLEREICQLNLDNEKLKSDLCEACSMYNNLAKRAECLEKELSNAQKRSQQQECDINELTKQVEELCNDKSYSLKQINKLELDLSSACNEIRELNCQIEDCKAKLCQQEDDMRSVHSEFRALDIDNQKLIAKIKEMEEHINCLKDHILNLQQQASTDSSRLQQEIRRLNSDLDQESCCRRELEYQIASKDQLINSLRYKCGV